MRESFRIMVKIEIVSGVQCENCGSIGMKRISRGWGCVKCQYFSKTAHKQGIKDWFMLMSDTMTNHECREFFDIATNYTAKRLISDLPLISEGVNRGTLYRYRFKA